MALESVLKSLGQEGTLRRILKAVSFPRAANQTLRVTVDNGITNYGSLRTWNHNTYASWYAEGGVTSVDAREPLAVMRRQAMLERMKKWTYT